MIADLRDDPRLDDADRRSIVAEMNDWMFTRPIEQHLQAAIGGTR